MLSTKPNSDVSELPIDIERTSRPLREAIGSLANNVSKRRSIKDACILVVDDHPSSRAFICACLERDGYRNLICASDGKEALQTALSTAPDLVVLDLFMPNMDGREFCIEFRKIEQFTDTPVLVQSSFEDGYSRSEVFEFGASDVVSKPIEIIEFLSRVRTHLERSFLMEDLLQYYHRMEEEVKIMQEMQECMLPDKGDLLYLTEESDLTIDAFYQPSDRLGGDLWGALKIDDHRFGFYIVDFSGHGAASSLNTFRLQTFVDSSSFDPSDPSAALQSINQYLSAILSTGTFATMIYCLLDTTSHQLKWAASGCPPPILVRKDGTSEELSTIGLPLGIVGKAKYECLSVPFEPGERLFIFSDGLIEYPKPDQPILSSEKVAELVTNPELGNASEMINCIKIELINTSSHSLPDDVSILAVHWKNDE